MFHKLRLVSLATVVALLCAASMAMAFVTRESPRLASPSQAQRTSMDAGNPIVSARRAEFNRGEVYGTIDAPPEKVWAVVYDYDRMKEWYPDMLKSKVLSRAEGMGTVEGGIKMPSIFANKTYHLEIRDSERQVEGQKAYVAEFNYIKDSRNMGDMYGYWLVYENPAKPGTTIVKYVVNADLDVWMPDFVLRWAQGRMLPGIIKGIRNRVK